MIHLKPYLSALFLGVSLLIASSARADEEADRSANAWKVDVYLARRDFRDLERMASEFRTKADRGPSGIPHLQHVYTEILNYLTVVSKLKGCGAPLAVIGPWLDSSPHSPTAIIADAEAIDVTAWCIRGTNYASDVPAGAMQGFEAYEREAITLLEKHKADAATDAQWYALMISLNRSIATDIKDIFKILEEGSSKFPGYNAIYNQFMIAVAPRWGGSDLSTEQFARWVADKTSADSGSDMYARLYWYASDLLHLGDLHKDTAIDWPMMVKAMNGVAKRYPDRWNLEAMARLSCQSGDIAEGVALLNQEQPPVDVAAWESLAKDGVCNNIPRKIVGQPL
jgi:hypothetical protein